MTIEIKKKPSGIIHTVDLNGKPFQLYDKQWNAITSQKPVTLLSGGLGLGKSYMLAFYAIMGSLMYPGSKYLLGSPTLKMAKGATLQKMLEILELHNIPYDYNKSNYEVTLNLKDKEGRWRESTTYFSGLLDYDKVRGKEYNWAGIDEINYIQSKSDPNKGKEALNTVLGRLRYKDPYTNQKFFPSKALIASTPKGKIWTFDDFYNNPKKNYGFIHATTYENPFLDKQYIKMMEEQYVGNLYYQEILGLFTAFKGMVFDIWKEEVNVISREEIEKKIANREIQAFKLGADWGFDPDPGVHLVVGIEYKNYRNHYYVMEEVYENKIPVIGRNGERDWIQIAIDLVNKYSAKGLVYLGAYPDKSRVEYNQAYINEGLQVQHVNNRIEEGVTTLYSFIGGKRLFVCSDCKNLIKEIEMYQRMPNGQILDAWNHAIDSLRYVVHSSEYTNTESGLLIPNNYQNNNFSGIITNY